MSYFPILCVHGYGVRAFFWDEFKKNAGSAGLDVATVDLKLVNIESAVDEVIDFVRTLSAEKKSPIVLMGHSLGGILSALAARDLGPDVLAGLIVISSPFGEKKN